MIIIYHSQGEPLFYERISENGFLNIIKKKIKHVLLQESLFFNIHKKILNDDRSVINVYMGENKNEVEPYDISRFYANDIEGKNFNPEFWRKI